MATKTHVRNARPDDIPLIAKFIRDLAAYEKLSDQCFVNEEQLHEHIFGSRPYCDVLIGEDESGPAGFALFFHNYSTFLANRGFILKTYSCCRKGAAEGWARRCSPPWPE
jgi:hypothetical protein